MGNVNSYLDTTYDEDYNHPESITSSDDDYDDPVSSYVISVSDDTNIEKNFIEVVKIGSGNFGIVYKAVCKQDNESYALKYVPILTPKNVEKREVEVLKTFDHKNVIKYYDDWNVVLPTSILQSSKKELIPNVKHAYSYIVMQIELCQDKNLRDLIISGEVFQKENEKKRRKWILDIICGLIYIHNNSIIHRDLKPENILIGMDDLLKIGDFGLARAYKGSYSEVYSATCTSKSEEYEDPLTKYIGTMPYVAPEVLKSTSRYSKKADYYSLGVILAELHHDMGPDRSRIMDKLRSEDFTDLIMVDSKVLQILISLLSRQPELRMELEAVLDMLPLEHQQSIENRRVSLIHLYLSKDFTVNRVIFAPVNIAKLL